MAEQETQAIIDRQLAESGITSKPPKVKDKDRLFKMLGDSKIPVAKSHGKLWKSRIDLSLAKRKHNNLERAWDEAVAYYKNDQLDYRDAGDGNTSRNRNVARRFNNVFSETENLIFANVASMVPAIYAKNPEPEITLQGSGQDERLKQLKVVSERLLKTLAAKKAAPGIGLKPKARKAVVLATLTNTAWIQVGYTHKENSSEEALAEIQRISEELQKAKSAKEIEAAEGRLMAMHERVDLLQPSGPWVKFRRGTQVLMDTAAQESDGTDGAWMGVVDFLPTAFIKAVYATQSGEEFKSIYQGTHVMKLGDEVNSGEDIEDEINNFSLIDGDNEDHKKYGFEDQETFDKAQMTKVCWVFDKITRRVFLFNFKDWTWPIWVWDDPYHLDRFFPLYKLEFFTDPEDAESKGEVTYYLDQQDAINEINSEERMARLWARKKVVYNSDMFSNRREVESFIKGEDDSVLGVPLGNGADAGDINKFFASLIPPSMRFKELFDKTGKYQAIDRISSTNEIARGGEFKTNTTNQAIEQYNTTAGVRLEEKTDAVEDWLGEIFWGVLQMCLQFMDAQQVSQIIGDDVEQIWESMSPETIQRTMSVRIVGGSSAKPTSKAKKQEALQIGQILGQFASASPAAIIVALKAMERAFDEVVVRDEDWKLILESVQAQLERGNSSSQNGQPQGGGEQQAQGQQGGQEQFFAELEQAIDTLPPEVKEALGTVLARGVPVREAIQRIMQMMQGQQQQQGNANAR